MPAAELRVLASQACPSGSPPLLLQSGTVTLLDDHGSLHSFVLDSHALLQVCHCRPCLLCVTHISQAIPKLSLGTSNQAPSQHGNVGTFVASQLQTTFAGGFSLHILSVPP